MSPASLVTGVPPPDYNKLKLEFGSYVQLFEDNHPTNTTKARSLGAIALTPTGNANGDYFFLSLATGACISRHQWTLLPITDQAISRVEALAKQEGQPLIQERGLVVEWRPDYIVDDDAYDRDYEPPDDEPADILNPTDYDPLDPDELDDLLVAPDDAVFGAFPPPPGPAPGAVQPHPDNENDPDNDNDYDHNDDDNNDYNDDDNNDDDNNNDNNDDDAPLATITEDIIGEETHMDADIEGGAAMDAGTTLQEEGAPAETPANRNRYDLRERHPRADRLRDAMDSPHDRQSYHAPVQLLHQGLDAQCNYIFGWVMTQMTAKAGLRKHGELAEAALLKEFTQQKDLDVWEILDPLKLTYEERMGALRALNLLKEKRNGDLKGRTVADGSKQKGMYPKSKTASPTVNVAALMLTILIDAYEKRDVATADVAGAYLKANMTDHVIIKFVGESVDILLKMEPSYVKFVTIEKGVKVLYARLKKALYGCVQSALLWYNLFHDTLKQMGFTINPYDPCVANCMIDGSQCTIAWYVDDTKISHVNPDVVTRIIDILEGHFGKMTVTRGKEHTFLGMNIVYTEDRTARITMKQYLQEALDESKMDIKYEAATPARKNLFDVDQEAAPLSKTEAETFHSVTSKLLYVAIRARMDILLPVGFLGTRVSKSTVEDSEKLKRLLEYIKGTIDEEYILGADSLTTMRTWVDASFAVHPDMKSHTGGVMSYGRGGFACKSTKQKTTMRSSTHAEMVGVSDYLPTTIWVTNFMREQGYPPLENFLEQDNESAIKLEANGRTSAGAKSRHLDIRYFWIKENLETMGINVRHCRTLQMLADFLTKPQQGSLFRTMRDVLLGKLPISALDQFLTSPSLLSVEERVGNMRPIGRNTDDKNEEKENIEDGTEGFILVKGKTKRTKKQVEKHLPIIDKRNVRRVKDKIVSWSLP
jgi:Reverse transcriptase (RNA-dependent DNA polymerase)